MRRLRTALLWATLALGAWPAAAAAESAPNVSSPTAAQVRAATGLLDRGEVVLVQSTAGGALQQVTLFARVTAPIDTVYEVIADPETLPQRELAMHDIEVRTRRDRALTFRWVYGDVIATIRGSTAMALAPPTAVQMRTTQGGFGPGEVLYRLYPEGESSTVVALALNYDVDRSSHPLLRWLSGRSPDFRQAWNLGYGIMAIRGIGTVAARRARVPSVSRSSGQSGSGPLRPPRGPLLRSLGPLLDAGRVAIIESDGAGRVAQAVVAERVRAPGARIQAILERPDEWGSFMRAIDVANAGEHDGRPSFDMSFSLPAFSVEANMDMEVRPDGCDYQSRRGRLHRSLLGFWHSADGADSILIGASRIRLRQAGRLLRGLIDDDPSFAHALNAAAVMTVSRALAHRAEGLR